MVPSLAFINGGGRLPTKIKGNSRRVVNTQNGKPWRRHQNAPEITEGPGPRENTSGERLRWRQNTTHAPPTQ
eukprot:6512386-Lingulodinium_polyedra.AAC.1